MKPLYRRVIDRTNRSFRSRKPDSLLRVAACRGKRNKQKSIQAVTFSELFLSTNHESQTSEDCSRWQIAIVGPA